MKEKKVGLAGAGLMSSSLAQVYALADYDVIVCGRSEAGIEKSKHLISINQESLIKAGMVTDEQSQKAVSKISFTRDMDCFSECPLVVESVVEQMDAKLEFWEKASRIAPENSLLATNTSGLKISEIANAVKNPERFMGQHWLNPPHIIPLCEIIIGEKTSQENVEKMKMLVNSLGKIPVIVKDINGFIANRIQFALLREACNIIESGAATFEDIDMALKGGLGLRYAVLGAFGVADFGGLDVFERISNYLNADLSTSKEGNKIFRKLVDDGNLGVKSGKGFYDYSGDKADKAIKERDKMYIELSKLLYGAK